MTTSSAGTTVPSAASITDASGHLYTEVGGVISVNGVVQAVTHGVILMYFDGVHVWQQTAQGWWEALSVSAANLVTWGAQTTDPRPVTPPPSSISLSGTFTASGTFVSQLPAFAEITGARFETTGATKVPITLGTTSGAADIMDSTTLNPLGLAGGDVLPVPADALLNLAFAAPQSIWINFASGSTVRATIWFNP